MQIPLLLLQAASGLHLFLSALCSIFLFAKGIFCPLMTARTYLFCCVINLEVRHPYTETNHVNIKIVRSENMVHHEAAKIGYLKNVFHFPK